MVQSLPFDHNSSRNNYKSSSTLKPKHWTVLRWKLKKMTVGYSGQFYYYIQTIVFRFNVVSRTSLVNCELFWLWLVKNLMRLVNFCDIYSIYDRHEHFLRYRLKHPLHAKSVLHKHVLSTARKRRRTEYYSKSSTTEDTKTVYCYFLLSPFLYLFFLSCTI